LAKIQEMKGISEALLPMVIYTICQELSLEEFRKELSGFTANAPSLAGYTK
jgi:hypothetical protein